MMKTEPTHYAPFYRAKEGDTTFLKERDYAKCWVLLAACQASKIYICEDTYRELLHAQHPNAAHLVSTPNPRLSFIKDLQNSSEFRAAKNLQYYASQHTNDVPLSTIIMQPSYVAFTVFGENCIVHPMCSIGAPALGVERDELNQLHDFPHIGCVRIGNGVVIDSLVTICRGSLDDTIVGDHCRIDNHVHIAHNCRIGPNCIMTAGATLGGSVTIGHDCWLGLNCTIMNGLEIADHVIVGQGANVVRDIKDEGDIFAGNPARSIKSLCKLSPEKLYMMCGRRVGEGWQQQK